MSASGSPADTPEFAAPAETNTSSENTIATVSSNSIPIDRKSNRSGSSAKLSWSVIQRNQPTVGASMNTSSMEVSDRSKQIKRSDHRTARSPKSSKSPRRDSEARGSDVPMTADPRLDQLLTESMRGNTSRGAGQGSGSHPLESSPPNPVSPSMAAQMMSRPRELTRALPISPQKIPITHIRSDENGREAVGKSQHPSYRNLQLNDEVVKMTQRH